MTQAISKMETTAVEWLMEELEIEMGYGRDLTKSDRRLVDEIFQQAKAMEKEQIMKAYENVLIDGIGDFTNGEQYYNETYGSKDM